MLGQGIGRLGSISLKRIKQGEIEAIKHAHKRAKFWQEMHELCAQLA